jgi:hypothetical protein
VGVQLFSRKASMVRLQCPEERQARMGESQRTPPDMAILLEDGDGVDDSQAVAVLVRGGSFTSMENVLMLDGDRSVTLRPKAVVERSAAFDKVTFAVVSGDA